MRLHPHLINYVAESVISNLISEGKIRSDDNRMLVGMVENIINSEIERETELDEEVREILAEHYEEMRHDKISYDEMFRMVKARLAREKGITI